MNRPSAPTGAWRTAPALVPATPLSTSDALPVVGWRMTIAPDNRAGFAGDVGMCRRRIR